MKKEICRVSFTDKIRNSIFKRRHIFDGDKLRSEYDGDYSLLNLIRGSEASISTSNSLRPVLASVGMGPCIAMAGYDSRQKIGFISHNGVGDYIEVIHDIVLTELNKISNGLSMDIHIVGGMLGSKELADDLRNYAKKEFNPKSINEDLALNISDWTYLGKSLVLDTRNGKIYSIDGGGRLQYLPPANPRISLR